LLLGGGLLGLVIANQAWLIFNIWRNRWLCLKINSKIGSEVGLKINGDRFQQSCQYQTIDEVGLLGCSSIVFSN